MAPTKTTSKGSQLLRLARRGPIRARDLASTGIPRAYLTRLVNRGQLDHAGRGLYRLPDANATELHSLAEVAARVPRATICLLSALQVHALTTEAPHAVWIMIDSRARSFTETGAHRRDRKVNDRVTPMHIMGSNPQRERISS